jgi:hypothetical protein
MDEKGAPSVLRGWRDSVHASIRNPLWHLLQLFGFSMLTRGANDTGKQGHFRMPVIGDDWHQNIRFYSVGCRPDCAYHSDDEPSLAVDFSDLRGAANG